MNRELYVGFKGKNNASCILAKAISADSYLLTNSFEGLKRDIDSLSCAYDSVILFGIDKNLTDTVRIEAVAEKDTRLYSTLNIAALSAQLNVAGIHGGKSGNIVAHGPDPCEKSVKGLHVCFRVGFTKIEFIRRLFGVLAFIAEIQRKSGAHSYPINQKHQRTSYR